MVNFISAPTMSEILQEEFLTPMNISAYKLAQELKFFGVSDKYLYKRRIFYVKFKHYSI